MSDERNDKTLASFCRWTIGTGEKGFTANQRPDWGSEFTPVDFVRLIAKNVVPRLPEGIEAVGLEFHYDNEINELWAEPVANALVENGLYLSMITPGAHKRFNFGGPASLDDLELGAAREFGNKTVDLAYGPLKKAWHPKHVPTMVLWNGSFGYDVLSPAISEMKDRLLDSLEGLCRYEEKAGGKLLTGIEPKPNEGHGKMLIQTAGDVFEIVYMLAKRGIDVSRLGSNLETGHSAMVTLDPCQDIDGQLRAGLAKHYHANSQGYHDGVTTGGPAMFDVDHEVKIDGQTIVVNAMMAKYGFNRWIGHDFQPRHHDNYVQAVNRIISSACAWEACKAGAASIDDGSLMQAYHARDTSEVARLMHKAIGTAREHFDKIYRPLTELAKN